MIGDLSRPPPHSVGTTPQWWSPSGHVNLSLIHSLTPDFFLPTALISLRLVDEPSLDVGLDEGVAHERCVGDAASKDLMRPCLAPLSRPWRPVRRDHDIDPSSLGILAATETPSSRRYQRVRLADGSHLLVRGRETPWRSRDHEHLTKNFTPSHHRPKYWLCTHRETQI